MPVTFLALLDRIIALVRIRALNRQQVFTGIVEPLFRELEPVVDDYFALFREAKRTVGTCRDAQLPDAIESIRARREELLTTRIKVKEMADIVRSRIRDKRVKAFASTVYEFFLCTQHPHRHRLSMSPSSELVAIVDLLELTIGLEQSRDVLLFYLDATLQMLQNRWVEIAQSYASLRLYCMQP